jgi:hypothetical protein
MVKVSETFPNYMKSSSTDSPRTSDLKLISFVKCQKMGEVAHTILRHQPKVKEKYKITEHKSVCCRYPVNTIAMNVDAVYPILE